MEESDDMKTLNESHASTSRWNPRHKKTGSNELVLPADTQFVAEPITQNMRDKEMQRVNKMVHDCHVRIGNACQSDASDGLTDDAE